MPSNWTSAFTHPDPLDPNDAQRQRTQARPKDYPYDRLVSYGSPVGTAMDGDAYQRPPDSTPPKPRKRKAADAIPYGEFGSAWEAADRRLRTYEPGPSAPDAALYGYGSHGRLGDGLEDMPTFEDLVVAFVEPDPLSLATAPSLLSLLDPGVDLIDPEDGCGPADIYQEPEPDHVYAPGAEFDEEDPEDEDLYL
ncbi:MAG TPA: hypothetical protein VFT74_18950 [Isosphaeraceae bacterium]|nr:hypothetical protein [Isosphaeraceae bacterium]